MSFVERPGDVPGSSTAISSAAIGFPAQSNNPSTSRATVGLNSLDRASTVSELSSMLSCRSEAAMASVPRFISAEALLGLMRRASPSSCAAPANSLSTSTPSPSCWQATYSLATRFMPSRTGPTQATSAAE